MAPPVAGPRFRAHARPRRRWHSDPLVTRRLRERRHRVGSDVVFTRSGLVRAGDSPALAAVIDAGSPVLVRLWRSLRMAHGTHRPALRRELQRSIRPVGLVVVGQLDSYEDPEIARRPDGGPGWLQRPDFPPLDRDDGDRGAGARGPDRPDRGESVFAAYDPPGTPGTEAAAEVRPSAPAACTGAGHQRVSRHRRVEGPIAANVS